MSGKLTCEKVAGLVWKSKSNEATYVNVTSSTPI